MRGVSDVGYAPVSGNSSTAGWFGILGGTHEKDCVLFMSRLKIVSGLPYKIVIQSWNTHASSSSQEALLWKAVARGSRKIAECTSYTPSVLLSFSRKQSVSWGTPDRDACGPHEQSHGPHLLKMVRKPERNTTITISTLK